MQLYLPVSLVRWHADCLGTCATHTPTEAYQHAHPYWSLISIYDMVIFLVVCISYTIHAPRTLPSRAIRTVLSQRGCL